VLYRSPESTLETPSDFRTRTNSSKSKSKIPSIVSNGKAAGQKQLGDDKTRRSSKRPHRKKIMGVTADQTEDSGAMGGFRKVSPPAGASPDSQQSGNPVPSGHASTASSDSKVAAYRYAPSSLFPHFFILNRLSGCLPRDAYPVAGDTCTTSRMVLLLWMDVFVVHILRHADTF
jgi:hypothetical protein